MKLSEIINNEKYNDNTRIRRPHHAEGKRSYPLHYIKQVLEWDKELLFCREVIGYDPKDELQADDWEIVDELV